MAINLNNLVVTIINVCTCLCLMPQSHTHLRTLRMVRKARPQLSAHSVTIRITSAEKVTVRILSATYRKVLSIRAQILKNIKKVLRMKTTQ